MFREVALLEGILWVPEDIEGDPWSLIMPITFVILGIQSFRGEVRSSKPNLCLRAFTRPWRQVAGEGEANGCAKFRNEEERTGVAKCKDPEMSYEEKAARMSLYTDSRGGMMMAHAAPIIVHIVCLPSTPLRRQFACT